MTKLTPEALEVIRVNARRTRREYGNFNEEKMAGYVFDLLAHIAALEADNKLLEDALRGTVRERHELSEKLAAARADNAKARKLLRDAENTLNHEGIGYVVVVNIRAYLGESK